MAWTNRGKHPHACLALLLVASSSLLGACGDPFRHVYITEFNAANSSGIEDEDGDRSDWLELYNDGAAPVDIGGFYLSDDENDKTKWRFPSPTVIPPVGFLVVYCSKKDRAVAGSQLHTNFRLSSQTGEALSEDLLLVGPDGVTVIDGYIDYARQAENHTYGREMNATLSTLVPAGTPARALVPTDETLGSTWIDPDFDDDAWLPGRTGVGYETRSGYEELIDLDVADLMLDTNSTCYVRVPFELASADIESLELRMKYDDGFLAYINGRLVARHNAPDELAWNSLATSVHDEDAAVVFETYPISQSGAELGLRVGRKEHAIHGLNRSLGSSDFLILPELYGIGGGALDAESMLFFPQATPGSSNGRGVERALPRPVFDPPCATFTDSIAVGIESGVEATGMPIRYTTDGEVPTQASPLYSGSPITIDSTTHLQARVFDPRTGSGGAIASSTYQELAGWSNLGGIPAPDRFSSNLPLMVVENFDARSIADPGEAFQSARVSVFEVDPGTGRSSLARSPTACFRIGIRRRGQSSADFPKAQYRVELRDEDDLDLDYPLLGLPADSDWVFNGPWTDKSLIRNSLGFELGREIGIEAPRTKHFEMFLSTHGGALMSSDYVGVYLLIEKIKRARDRVDIAKLSPADRREPEITGGYLMRFEPADLVASGLEATRWKALDILDPDTPTPQQREYIENYLDEFAATLGWTHGSGPNDSGAINNDPLRGYPAYLDVDSFVHLLLINELLRNQDAYVRSDFMFKPRSGKLRKGPLWDLNLIAGTGCCFDNRNTAGWQHEQSYNRGSLSSHNYEPDWFVPLLRDPDFKQRWIDRWSDLRRDRALERTALLARIDAQADPLAESALRNFSKWDTLGEKEVGFPTPATSNWQEQIDVIKSWLTSRMAWIDSQFVASASFNQDGGSVRAGFLLTMTSSPADSEIYYTLDGSDPRLWGADVGGDISPSADRYDGPIPITQQVRVFARARRDEQWSAPEVHTFVTVPRGAELGASMGGS